MVPYNPQRVIFSQVLTSHSPHVVSLTAWYQVTLLYLASIYKFSKSMIYDLYADIWFAIVSNKTGGAMIF